MDDENLYILLFQLYKNGSGFTADTTTNILSDWPVGKFVSTGETVESLAFQDQLVGNSYKTFIGGNIDGGTITLSTPRRPDLQPLRMIPPRYTKVLSPAFLLFFAVDCEDQDRLKIRWSGGVNYLGGGDFDETPDKPISLKFKVTDFVEYGMQNGMFIQRSWGSLQNID